MAQERKKSTRDRVTCNFFGSGASNSRRKGCSGFVYHLFMSDLSNIRRQNIYVGPKTSIHWQALHVQVHITIQLISVEIWEFSCSHKTCWSISPITESKNTLQWFHEIGLTAMDNVFKGTKTICCGRDHSVCDLNQIIKSEAVLI